MPWKVEQGHGCPADKPWAVMQADGTRMGCHATEDDAKGQQAALYAKEGQRMTAEAPPNPLDVVPEWARPLLPDWVGALRDRAVALDDMEVMDRAKGGDGRTVTAYAAVFDTPAEVHDQDGHYLEQIHRAAFDRSLQARAGKISVFYNHGKDLYRQPSDRFAIPIGKPLEIRADQRGLRTVTQYNRTPLADEVLEAIKSGSMRGMSFTGGFLRSDPAGPYYQRSDGSLALVTRQEIALIEYGPTPIPNYEGAEVVGVRSQAADRPPERETITVSTDPPSSTADPDSPAPSTEDPDGTPEQDSPAPSTEDAGTQAPTTAPGQDPAPQAQRSTPMTEPQPMTATERAVRQGEIRERMAAIDTEFAGAELPADVAEEWNRISEEFDVHERAIAADAQRKERIRQLADRQATNGGGESVGSRAGYGMPAVHLTQRAEDIYDLVALRQRARSVDDLPALYRENAMRAVELARFPGVHRFDGFTREDAQRRVQELLDGVDDGHGTLAERILVTGSPLYERAFGKWLARGGFMGLTGEEQAALSRALSMGSATSAQLAVPFTLDPTVILTSDGATNPLRAISRVETITGRTWEGVTSAGITVARAAEAAAASDNAPALAQPTVTPTRVQGFVPFSIEADQDWTQLRSEMTRLLQDAKDVEEATSFVTGNGTPPNPSGIASTLTTASNVNDGSTSFEAADIYAVENALPPRFQPRARWLARKNTYNLIRALDTNGTLYARLTEGRPPELLGYPAHEASAMYLRNTFGNRYAILGDFSNFLIVDKAGMDVELVPHLFDVTNNMPTGQRGLYAIWRNNADILVDNAFRALTYAT